MFYVKTVESLRVSTLILVVVRSVLSAVSADPLIVSRVNAWQWPGISSLYTTIVF